MSKKNHKTAGAPAEAPARKTASAPAETARAQKTPAQEPPPEPVSVTPTRAASKSFGLIVGLIPIALIVIAIITQLLID